MAQNKDYALVVDSTTRISDDIKEIVRVEPVSLSITVENVNKPENDWTVKEIAEAVKANKRAHSSCPSPAEFASAYENLFDEGYKDILVLPMDYAISNTASSAKMGIQLLDDDKAKHVVVLDIREANYGVVLLVRVLSQYIKEGYDFKKIVAKAKELAPNFHQCWTMASLEPLYKGGRLSRFSFIVGTFLKIKPIIGINEAKGNLEAEKKVRTFNDVDRYFLEKIQEAVDKYDKVYMSFIRMGDEELMNNLIKKYKEQFPKLEYVTFDTVGPLFTVHLGDAGYGIGYIGEGLKKQQTAEKKNIIDRILGR